MLCASVYCQLVGAPAAALSVDPAMLLEWYCTRGQKRWYRCTALLGQRHVMASSISCCFRKAISGFDAQLCRTAYQRGPCVGCLPRCRASASCNVPLLSERCLFCSFGLPCYTWATLHRYYRPISQALPSTGSADAGRLHAGASILRAPLYGDSALPTLQAARSGLRLRLREIRRHPKTLPDISKRIIAMCERC